MKDLAGAGDQEILGGVRKVLTGNGLQTYSMAGQLPIP
jgi:hypothetical protein